jgi:para-nitrobenzyl esterase
MKRADALQAGVKLGESFGAHTISDLRGIAADQLLSDSSGTGPIIDGSVVTDEPIQLFRSGKQHDVPLLVGGNANEGSANTISATEYLKQSRERFVGVFDSFVKLYPGNNDEQAKASQLAFAPDSMAWRMWIWADSHAKTAKSKTFIYTFSRPAPPGDPEAGRAHHGAELPYVFHNTYRFNHQWADRDHELEKLISSYWVNFAVSGDPNGSNLPHWPRYDPSDSERVMILGDRVEFGRSSLDKAKITFFEAYYNQLLTNPKTR